MKRIVIALMIIFFSFCSGGEALAATYKPPSSICFSCWSTEILTLTIKAMGKVTMADGSTQFYAINGVLFDTWTGAIFHLVGTGYMSKGEANQMFNFMATSTGFHPYIGQQVSYHYLGAWNVVEGSGYMSILGYSLEGFMSGSGTALTTVDCKTQTIPTPIY